MARSRVVLLVMAGMLIGGPLALAIGLSTARERTLAPKVSGVVAVAPATIAGKVRYPDGLSAVANAPVSVWSDSAKAFVQQTRTGKDGAYSLSPLPPGNYLVIFADRVSVRLHVSGPAGGKAVSLDVVIPHGQAAFAQMPPEQQALVLSVMAVPAQQPQGAQPEGVGSGSGLLPTLAIGAGGITAVAAIAEWSESDSHHHRRRVNSP